MPNDEDLLLAPLNADRELLIILTSESKVHDEKPRRMAEAYVLIRQALEICAGAHRRGGVTSRQLQDLERLRTNMEALAA